MIAGTLGTVLYFFARFYSKTLTSSVLIPVLIGQVCAIIFAFFANKFFVFNNKGTGFKKSCQQFFEFCMGRALVFLIDIGIAHFFVDKYARFSIYFLRLKEINYQNTFFASPLLHRFIGNPFLLNEFIFTSFSQIIGMIINYVVSKKIVFKLQKEHQGEMAYL